MGIAASEVFLTWCQQPYCRLSSHLQIQSHPFRERKNNAIKIRVFLLQANPRPLWPLDTGLLDRALPLRSISTWHLSRITGTLAAVGVVTVNRASQSPVWTQADVSLSFRAQRQAPGVLRRTPENCTPSASAHHFLPDWASSEKAGCGLPGKAALSQPSHTLPFDLFPPDCVTLWAVFFSPLIWHPWKLVLNYRFPAFISLNYNISWEEGFYEMPGKGAEPIKESQAGF